MLTVALDRIGRQGNYRQVPGKLPAVLHLSDAPRGVEAIHLRHLAVHQHQIELLALDGLDRLQAVLDRVALHTALAQHSRANMRLTWLSSASSYAGAGRQGRP